MFSYKKAKTKDVNWFSSVKVSFPLSVIDSKTGYAYVELWKNLWWDEASWLGEDKGQLELFASPTIPKARESEDDWCVTWDW